MSARERRIKSGLSSSQEHRKRLLRWLEAQDWRCYWCACALTLSALRDHGRCEPNDATVDHLDDRTMPWRGLLGNLGRRRVVACFKCNNERGIAAAERKHADLPPMPMHAVPSNIGPPVIEFADRQDMSGRRHRRFYAVGRPSP